MCENILGMIVASKPNLVDRKLHFIVSKPNLGRHRKRACVVTMHMIIFVLVTHTRQFPSAFICGYGNIDSAKTETTVVECLVVCGQCSRDS